MDDSSERKFVLPGEYLCSVEEFAPGKNTFADDDGIYSTVCGNTHYIGKTVTVERGEQHADQIDVVGGIEDMRHSCAFVVAIETIPKNADVKLLDDLSLPVSRLGSYVRDIKDAIHIGDVVKARLMRTEKGYELGFFDRTHGVVKGFCSRCRGSMFLKTNMLICSLCGNTERRKISSDYGFTGTAQNL